MADLSTTFMGLKLKNPLIAGSSGLTSNVQDIKKLEDTGAAAVVLKSIFEEEILYEAESIRTAGSGVDQYSDAESYIKYYVKEDNVDHYIDLIKGAKQAVSIPIIASINCVSSGNWTSFAHSVQAAGADALEINIFVMPSDLHDKSEEIEKVYFDVVKKVLKEVTIPVSLKIGYHFTAMANTIVKLSQSGVNSLVLFNRFYNPDIDIDSLEITSGGVLSHPEEISLPLRWIGMLSNEVECELAASTGVHDGHGMIKLLLAGAQVVSAVSAMYLHGPECMDSMLKQLTEWMDRKKYSKIEDFRGLMKRTKAQNAQVYERAQFMKYFSSFEG